MTAQDDDQLFAWLITAEAGAGDFLKTLCVAALRADHDNYRMLRGVLLLMKQKYPQYQPLEFACPVCGGTEFLEGPHGGHAVNFLCATNLCGERFNDMVMGIKRIGKISDSEREAFNRGPWKPRTASLLEK